MSFLVNKLRTLEDELCGIIEELEDTPVDGALIDEVGFSLDVDDISKTLRTAQEDLWKLTRRVEIQLEEKGSNDDQ